MIVGAHGQLGQELQRYLTELGWKFVALSSLELDITEKANVEKTVMKYKPTVIFNVAAYTAVDKAETEGKEANWQVNVLGTQNLVSAASKSSSKLIYISTDYVFDGTKKGLYLEDDQVNPQNEYGRAKLAGENIVRDSGIGYYIVRTSWVYGEFGNNFVYTMKKLAKKRTKLQVVDDQRGRPTWTRTLAEFLVYLLKVNAPLGTYQLCNENTATWYEFACEILKQENVEIEPVDSHQFRQVAKRPENVVMSLDKAQSIGFNIITWQEALGQFLRKAKF